MKRSSSNAIIACTIAVALLLVGAHALALVVYQGFAPLPFCAAAAGGAGLLSLLLYATSSVLARRGRGVLPKLLLVGGSLGLFFSICDLVVVGVVRDSSGWRGESCLAHRPGIRPARENKDGFWERDLDFYRGLGDRDRFIVAVVGDSFTLGQGLEDRRIRFTDQLERLLRDSEGLDVTILNFGRPGEDTVSQKHRILPIVEEVRPDIVVLGYLSNDNIANAQRHLSTIDCFRPPSLLWRSLIRLSPSISYLHCRMYIPWADWACGKRMDSVLIDAYLDHGPFAEHREALRSLLGSCAEIGDDVLFVLLPYPSMWEDRKGERDRIYGKILRVVEELGVRAVDLSPIEDLHSLEWFTLGDIDPHPSPEAHRAIAEALVAPLAEMIRAQQPGHLSDISE